MVMTSANVSQLQISFDKRDSPKERRKQKDGTPCSRHAHEAPDCSASGLAREQFSVVLSPGVVFCAGSTNRSTAHNPNGWTMPSFCAAAAKHPGTRTLD